MMYMKKILKTVRLIMVTFLLILVSQASVFAADNQNISTSTLSAAQILSGFAILLLTILLPLLKKRPKVVYYRIIKTYKRK